MNYLLIDGNYEAFRACFMSSKLGFRAPDGTPTGGIYLFLKALYRHVTMEKYSEVIVVFDGGHAEFRKELYPAYKANRKKELLPGQEKTEEELAIDQIFDLTFKELPKLIRGLGIKSIRMRGQEADDVLYRLSEKFVSQGHKVTVVSEDSDFLQFLTLPNLKLFKPRKEEWLDTNTFLQSYGFSPKHFYLFKSITGDGKDNIIGVRGWGDATTKKLFHKLIEENKEVSIDNIFSTLEGTTKKKEQALLEERDLIELNSKVLDLRTIPLTSDDVYSYYMGQKEGTDLQYIQEEFKRLGIHSLSHWVVYTANRL